MSISVCPLFILPVVFTALDTNVGSPNGVTVSPAGYLQSIIDPLGVGSDVYMTSSSPIAATTSSQTTTNPQPATYGLPAHLVLTGNGVAVIQNDHVDIWDWDNTCSNCCCADWVLIPRKPQEQGTMVYHSSSHTNGHLRPVSDDVFPKLRHSGVNFCAKSPSCLIYIIGIYWRNAQSLPIIPSTRRLAANDSPARRWRQLLLDLSART